MTDYTELVKMLRTCADRDSCVGWDDTCPYIGAGMCDNKAEKTADAIEELQKDNAALNGTVSNLIQQIEELSKPRWIPVTERLPEPYTWVLVFAEKHEVAFDAYYDGTQWKDAFLNGLVVTHWMPLPEPPEEET